MRTMILTRHGHMDWYPPNVSADGPKFHCPSWGNDRPRLLASAWSKRGSPYTARPLRADRGGDS